MSHLHPSHPRAPLGVLHMADEVGTALAGWAGRGGHDPDGSSALPLAGWLCGLGKSFPLSGPLISIHLLKWHLRSYHLRFSVRRCQSIFSPIWTFNEIFCKDWQEIRTFGNG